MVATATVTYNAEGSPDTILSFNLTGTDADDIHRKLASKKRDLDKRFNVDSENGIIWVVSR
jgi:hypothetical protein